MSQEIIQYLESFREFNIDGKPIPKVQHFSFWSYSLAVCMKKWYSHVIVKGPKIEQDMRNALEGSAIHASVETVLKHKSRPMQDLPDYSRAAFKKLVKDSKIITWKSKTDKRECQSRVDEMAVWMRDFFEKTTLLDGDRYELFPEESFKVMVSKTAYITGRIDLWVKDRETGDNLILDWKCGAKKQYLKKDQLIFYSLAALAKTLLPVTQSAFVMPLLKDVDTHVLRTEDYLNMLARVEAKAREVENAMQERIFPMNKSDQNCMFCPMAPQCGVVPKVTIPQASSFLSF